MVVAPGVFYLLTAGVSCDEEKTMSQTDSIAEQLPQAAPAEGLPTHEVSLSDVAAEKVRDLLEQEGRPDLRLRIAVQPGGCSGLIYQLYFDERVLDGDAVKNYGGVEVSIDKLSVPCLAGAPIAFEVSIAAVGFTIDTPQAAGSCAWGASSHSAQETESCVATAGSRHVGRWLAVLLSCSTFRDKKALG